MRSGSILTIRVPSLLFGALALLVAGSAAVSQERDPPRFKDESRTQQLAEPRAVLVDAPNARMVALVRSPDARVVLQKGVERVNRIARGVYCIKPDPATGINPATAVATVSVDYFYSLFNEVTVQVARRQSGCGNDRFAVYTFDDENLDAVYSFSNAVGFVIVVP